jgi:hypothetical protein
VKSDIGRTFNGKGHAPPGVCPSSSVSCAMSSDAAMSSDTSSTGFPLPDEILDYVLSLVSWYGDLRRCKAVDKRWAKAVDRVARKSNRQFANATENREEDSNGLDEEHIKSCRRPKIRSNTFQRFIVPITCTQRISSEGLELANICEYIHARKRSIRSPRFLGPSLQSQLWRG